MNFRFTASIIMLAALTAGAQSKLDMQTRLLVDELKAETVAEDSGIRPSTQYSADNRNADGTAGLTVTLNDGYSEADLTADGVQVLSVRGSVAVVSAPVSSIEQLAQLDAVRSISAGKKQRPLLSNARSQTATDAVLDGTDSELGRAYTGAGVVTGLMDTGIDPNHITFMKQDLSESRVKEVYTFLSSNGSYTAYTTPDAIKRLQCDLTSETHGTHVAGIMSGGYNGSGDYYFKGVQTGGTAMPYYGVAYGSDIVMSGGYLYNTNIMEGVERVIEYAKGQGKPAVVNLSLGSNVGPHDGSDELSRYLAEAGNEAIICVAAGNDGETPLAISRSFSALTKQLRTCIIQSATRSSSDPGALQFWNSTSDAFTASFVLYSKTDNKIVYEMPITQTGQVITVNAGSDSNFSSAFASSSYVRIYANTDPINNRYYVQMQYLFNRASSSDRNIVPAINITGTSGQKVNGYIDSPDYFSSENITGWQTGTTNGSISDMATGENIITIGAFTSSRTFGMLSGGIYSYNGATNVGELCSFSSYGSSFDGRELPDLCAPGSALISSVNYYYYRGATDDEISGYTDANGRANHWASMQGTSMATPFACGVVALMLEADPTLTVSEVRDILTSTATAPPSSADSNQKIQWGAGKINTLAAMKEVLSRKASIGSVWSDDASRLMVEIDPESVEVFVAGETALDVALYGINGMLASSASGNGDRITVSTAGLSKGVYILTVQGETGRYTRRVLIK